MEPTIGVGDAVVVKETDEVKVNDVIAFGHGKAITVHRVIKINEEGEKTTYQTQGDNNNAPDLEPVEKQNIKGIVVNKIPKVGDAILFLQNHIVIFIGVIAVLVVLVIARRLI